MSVTQQRVLVSNPITRMGTLLSEHQNICLRWTFHMLVTAGMQKRQGRPEVAFQVVGLLSCLLTIKCMFMRHNVVRHMPLLYHITGYWGCGLEEDGSQSPPPLIEATTSTRKSLRTMNDYTLQGDGPLDPTTAHIYLCLFSPNRQEIDGKLPTPCLSLE